MNTKQRTGRGARPALIFTEANYNIIKVCPGLITVPVDLEAVWFVLHPKGISNPSHFNFIAVCSYYYAGPKQSNRYALYT